MEIVESKNGIQIRLNEERWIHITEEHSEMAGYYYEVLETVKNPDIIYEGKNKECVALKKIEGEKYIVVIYKEDKETKDGFIITSFLTKRKKQFEKRRKIWER